MPDRRALPLTAAPELFIALGGRPGVGMIIDGLYDRLERDPELRPREPHGLHDLFHHRDPHLQSDPESYIHEIYSAYTIKFTIAVHTSSVFWTYKTD